LNEADVVIAHNAAFDIGKTLARAFTFGIKPPLSDGLHAPDCAQALQAVPCGAVDL
jgi:DNA polymerase III epsilon subunit-like protein